MAQSITDPPHVILWRILLSILYHTTRCWLHRKHFLIARKNNQDNQSRRFCIQSAIDSLQHQVTFDEEMQFGGQLHGVRWKNHSMVNHEFLLATTILCVEMVPTCSSGSPGMATAGSEKEEEIKKTLRRSYQIWSKASKLSREAQQAVRALRYVLDKADSTGFGLESRQTMAGNPTVSSPGMGFPWARSLLSL